MIIREQFEEIQAESREKGVPIKRWLQEKGVPDGFLPVWAKRLD